MNEQKQPFTLWWLLGILPPMVFTLMFFCLFYNTGQLDGLILSFFLLITANGIVIGRRFASRGR